MPNGPIDHLSAGCAIYGKLTRCSFRFNRAVSAKWREGGSEQEMEEINVVRGLGGEARCCRSAELEGEMAAPLQLSHY